MATAADVPDEFNSWWVCFNNGAVDEEEEEEEEVDDSDTSDDEEGDRMTVDEKESGARQEGDAAAAALDDEKISEDSCVQLEGGLQRRKRKATVCDFSGGNKEDQAQHLRAQNETLRLQLALKTKKLEGEENRRLKLELYLKTKEIKSLRKQIREMRDENECYKKTVKPPRNPRLCRYCQKYGLHDCRNCPERRSSASSEEEEGDDDYN